PSPSADAAAARDMAASARLARVEVQPRPPVESGNQGEVVLDLTAVGGYDEIFRFFEKVALSHRLVELSLVRVPAFDHGQNV
ncbi:MAG: type 4a pilus biogenesis protein PilO, partial [Syntrophobacteraceae bacterium]|nr:type 4a pilus biogenesis protein PilO [Syntrophobacteraceae bacterium]